ncbi:MAG: DUF421 domain-containing protein [Propionibacteriaceae bacterium]|jgi:uncharacterized membrane protein YcaP (DUF421 family)|nr:DUF421 domain-containing protein [Propionibacteriaceae bacterium]
MWERLWAELGIGGWQALALVVATTVLFWFFTWLMHAFGARLRLRVSTASLALMTVVGAITARSILGERPTMAAGVIALTVLFFWEWVLRRGSRWLRRRRGVHRLAWLVMADGQVRPEPLRKLGISEGNLMIRLRRAGVTALRQVEYAIIESDGSLTVVRAGQDVDPELLVGVAGLAGRGGEPVGDAAAGEAL